MIVDTGEGVHVMGGDGSGEQPAIPSTLVPHSAGTQLLALLDGGRPLQASLSVTSSGDKAQDSLQGGVGGQGICAGEQGGGGGGPAGGERQADVPAAVQIEVVVPPQVNPPCPGSAAGGQAHVHPQ